jgi:hypothetical protein
LVGAAILFAVLVFAFRPRVVEFEVKSCDEWIASEPLMDRMFKAAAIKKTAEDLREIGICK